MRKHFFKQLLITSIMLASIGINAQTITSVTASLNGAQVTVTYDFTDPAGTIPRYMYLLISTDGGTTYSYLQGTSGDIGGPMTTGTGKTITWSVFADYPTGLAVADATFKVRGLPFETVPVAGGTFQMGCQAGRDNIVDGLACQSDETPVHTITLSSYAIGKYEITNAQYVAFLNDTGVSADGSFADAIYGSVTYIDMAASDVMIVHDGTVFSVRDNSANGPDLSEYPGILVTWYGANAYAAWVGGRLPTEAEWEFASRGGNSSQGYQYSGSNTVGDVAWFETNSNSAGQSNYNSIDTHPIGTLAANELGIYDMSGNVYEWCQDWYDSSYYSSSPATDPEGPVSGTVRVLRGAYWNFPPGELSSANRNSASAGFSGFDIGFRVVVP